jgi:hypothetical protein
MLPVFKNYRKVPFSILSLGSPKLITMTENSIVYIEMTTSNGGIRAYYEVPTGTGGTSQIDFANVLDYTTPNLGGGSTRIAYTVVASGFVPRGKLLTISTTGFGTGSGIVHIFELPDEVL